MHKATEGMQNIASRPYKFSDFNCERLKTFFQENDQEAFRGVQAYNWFYRHKVRNVEDMHNLSKKCQSFLLQKFDFSSINVAKSVQSSDGTIKIVHRLSDGNIVETVLIQHLKHQTVCVSSQVGCAMGCKFCLTAKMGFKRNLTVGEIVDQYLNACTFSNSTPRNIVFMGMGEPLLNYDNVKEAISIFTHKEGLNIGRLRITVSTCGIASAMEKFIADPQINVNLALSLNSVDDLRRQKIMPISKKYPLSRLVTILKNYPQNKPPVLIEYILIKDHTDSLEDAKVLRNMLKDLNCKVNLTLYNESERLEFRRPDKYKIYQFQKILLDAGINTTQRHSKGQDISAACGSLAGRD